MSTNVQNCTKYKKMTEIYQKTLEYFQGDELAAHVWMNKYCLKNNNHYEELSPDDMHHRLAKELARIEKKYPNPVPEEEIYNALKGFKRIVLGGSPMSGIGNNYQYTSLSNCYVIASDNDSYSGICKLDQELVQLQKRRGGVGIDVSFIRPEGSPVLNSAITSTGVVPFMKRYSNSTNEVAQDGRRGALILSISVKHPDAERFIDAKVKRGEVTGANISVKLTDEFMKAVEKDGDYIQTFPIDRTLTAEEVAASMNAGYDKTEILNGVYIRKIKARKLWKKIVKNAHQHAEPGILLWDTIMRESVADSYDDFLTVSTNPCSELPLCSYDSCRLLNINLMGYVVHPFTADAYFDWIAFKKDAILAQRLMDDIVDLEIEKIDRILGKIASDPEDDFTKMYERNLWEKIREKAVKGRRTGLGVTAEGDMLAALGEKYGTSKATNFSELVHMWLKHAAYYSSVVMARERGAFPVYDSQKELDNPFIKRIKNEDIDLYYQMLKHGRRNIALLTIPPTGSVSIMTRTTSGIEPLFSAYYSRKRKASQNEKGTYKDEEGVNWIEYNVLHKGFETWLRMNGYDIESVKDMGVREMDALVEKSPYATANDIDWVEKVRMQGAIQKHVDHSISATVNIPENSPESLVEDIYKEAHRCGCKGITVYRQGSRDGILTNKPTLKDSHAPKRPKRLKADIVRFQNNLEKWIAVVGVLDGRPYEIFTGKLENGLAELPGYVRTCEVVKKIFMVDGERLKRYDVEYIDSEGNKHIIEGLNKTFKSEYWNYAKLISGILRHGMPLTKVVELVDSLSLNSNHLNTWKNGVIRVIKKYIHGKMGGACNMCGGDNLESKEGCLTCMDCGSSACG